MSVLIGVPLYGQLRINEVVSDNENSLSISDHSPDWIEIWNPTADVIELHEYFLTDDPDSPTKFRFPRSKQIAPNQAVILITDFEGLDTSLGYVPIPFGINKLGDLLILHRGSFADSNFVRIPKLYEDQSFAWDESTSRYVVSNTTTPGKVNDNIQRDERTSIFISNKGDTVYRDSATVQFVITKGICDSINYSIDGGTPNIAYFQDKEITLRTQSLPLYYSNIPTRSEYRLPEYNDRFHHVRVRCYDRSRKGFSEDQKTIVLDDQIRRPQNIPSVLIDVKEEDFFDFENGIYVEGEDRNFDKNGKAWKKDVSWSLLVDDEILESGKALAEIHGHATRELPQKSLKLTKISTDSHQGWAPPFMDSVRLTELILRSFHSELIRYEFTDYGFRDDVVMRILQNEKNIYPQKGQLVNVYLNGEYWGIHSLREGSDLEKIATSEKLSTHEIQIDKGPQHVFELYQKYKHLNLNVQREYDEFMTSFDEENLLNYVLAEVWFYNRDWPYNNIKTWKLKGEEGPYRFILFDMDATMKFPREDGFQRFEPANVPVNRNEDHYLFFRFLMQSKIFQSKILQRYLDWKNDILSIENTDAHLNDVSRQFRPEIRYHTKRWHYPRSLAIWDKSQEDIRDFLELRSLYLNPEITQWIDFQIFPNPSSGSVSINLANEIVDEYRWLSMSGTPLCDWTLLQSSEIEKPLQVQAGLCILEIKGQLGRFRKSVVFIPE